MEVGARERRMAEELLRRVRSRWGDGFCAPTGGAAKEAVALSQMRGMMVLHGSLLSGATALLLLERLSLLVIAKISV